MSQTAKIHFVKRVFPRQNYQFTGFGWKTVQVNSSVWMGGVGLVNNKVSFVFSFFEDGDDNLDGSVGFIEGIGKTKGEALYRVASAAAVDLAAIDPGFSKTVRQMKLNIARYMIIDNARKLYLMKGIQTVGRTAAGVTVPSSVKGFLYTKGAEKVVSSISNFVIK